MAGPVGGVLLDRGEDRLFVGGVARVGVRAEIDSGRRGGLPSDERAHLKDLGRENRELRGANVSGSRWSACNLSDQSGAHHGELCGRAVGAASVSAGFLNPFAPRTRVRFRATPRFSPSVPRARCCSTAER